MKRCVHTHNTTNKIAFNLEWVFFLREEQSCGSALLTVKLRIDWCITKKCRNEIRNIRFVQKWKERLKINEEWRAMLSSPEKRRATERYLSVEMRRKPRGVIKEVSLSAFTGAWSYWTIPAGSSCCLIGRDHEWNFKNGEGAKEYKYGACKN